VFLPRLEGEAREQGTILLAESLEEQDRAVEAIRLLQTAVPTPDTERELLLTRASLVGRTGASAEDLKSMRAALQDSLERDERPGDRARVAVAFSRIAPWLGGRAEAAEILKDVESISIDTLSPIASAHFHCAKARLAYLAGRKDFLVSEQAALAAIAQQLEGGGIRSGVTYAVLAHLASIAITLGDYQSAMQCAEAGLREAKARGNDYERVRQGVNIALALCRLGRYREQGDMALSLLPAAKGGRDFVLLCKGVYYTAIAKAFLGDPSAAVDILRREMPEAPHGAAPWVLQAHGFLSADILLLSGRFREARTCGAQALTLSAHEPLSEQYRGTFARWLALAGGELFSHTEIMENLTSMARQKETLDLADRAEVFAAIGWLGRGRGEDVASAQEELQRCLAVLPPAVKYQLDRLLPTT
jgi:tetratricopeptide (TPR) repeat protein